ncbi:hypothetical protein ABB37_08526 [Leptomonas pyrrhocoris]|uniref:Uncharacterized protein n=1 Tax=Leptomonas pyrrhocoris TaxID=157538 RepID=A0A0M9FSJ4_LEPPY|nr:hypothetical protein ABB37_08526 [Leptomonas pyrrhocoris]KPA75210.1 hypothetical protein ABB37_08526 [Leptomonas pyrrhocoris]|eukprot:XP_015653649.1 hypothetical protein ABB37_08526 [Leptomonas pyrrhocoris]
MSSSDDFPTLVSSLQASTVEWNLLGAPSRLTGSGVFNGASLHNKYLRFMQVLQEIEELFSIYRLSPNSVLIAWCASLQDSGVASHFVGLLVALTLQGSLSYLALTRCLRLVDEFLSWTTRVNAGCDGSTDGVGATGGPSCPVLVPSSAVVKWVEQTWSAVQSLSRDNAGTSTPTATAGLCGALQLLPVLLRWNVGHSPLPVFRRGQLPHPVNMQSEEVRLLAFRSLPAIVRHQPTTAIPQSYAHEIIDYVKRGCVKSSDIFVRIAAGSSVRGVLENGLRVLSPDVAYALMDMLLCLCDDVAPYDISDEVLYDVGVAMGYLLAFYQSDFTLDSLSDILQAAAPPSKAAAAAEERIDAHRRGGGGGGGGSGPAAGGAGTAAGANAGHLRWRYFGGADAVEGSRVVQRCFNERMTRTAQRALATALATLCSACSTPATTSSVIQCCFVLLVPIEGDARAYMPRLLADAIQEWARQLPSNGYRVVLADVLRGYVQQSGEDKAVVRTAMVALQGVVRTLSSSLEIGFNVAEDVLAAVNATPSLLHTGVEVLGAVARTNTLYARQLQHQCARADSAEVANTLTFQLHIRALLDASISATEAVERNGHGDPPSRRAAEADDAFGEEDRVSLVHVCIRLLLRLSRGDPPRAVQDIHYRQAELIFRLTQLIYDLLRASPSAVVCAARDELQPCTLGFMNLLVSSPAPSIAFYKAVTAACAMLRRAPVVSDTERMLAVGFLESRLASQDGVARHNVDATGSSAATAYFAVSKGALYSLVSCAPWPTCKDDGSLRWLAAQALKDIARACAHSAPVFSFEETHGPAVAAAAQSMKLVRSTLLHRCVSSSTISASAETPAHPLEECGGSAVRLLRWTLRHFVARGAVPVCVALLASLDTDLFKLYATPVNAAATVEEQARQTARREVGLWNTLCTVHELLLEASPHTAAALWANAKWKAEVQRWHAVAAQLIPASAEESVEVRLLAAKVLALCLVSTGQVDVFTSQTVAAVAQGSPSQSLQMDSLGALMVLCEAHSHPGEAAGDTPVESSPTLPLATSLLSEVWRRLVSAAPATGAANIFSAPVLTLLSLRLAQVYPMEVEAALSDSVVGVLLTPMAASNYQWWSSTTAVGMLTAVVQLWSNFVGSNSAVGSVPQTSALLLVQESLRVTTRSHQMPVSAVKAALDAVEVFSRNQARNADRCVAWRRLLHLCLTHTTHAQHEEEGVPGPLAQNRGRRSQRRVAVPGEVSKRLASLWCCVLLGDGSTPLVTAAVADAGCTRQLTVVEVAVQIDLAAAAPVRRGWLKVAQAMCSSLLPRSSSPDHVEVSHHSDGASTAVSSPPTLTLAFKGFLDAVNTVLQSRSPDVQVDIAKRDTDMFAAVGEGSEAGTDEATDGARGGGGSDSDDMEDYAAEFESEGIGGILSEAGGGGERGEGRGGGTAASAVDNNASLTFDVAAKEAAMWVLYSVLRGVGGDTVQTDQSTQRTHDVRRAVLPMVVAAAQLVEVHPEVHIATIAVLHEVFALWGHVTQVQELARPLAVLMPWKTQLVVSLTTVLQHGLLSLEGCTALAVQYSRCNLADTSSCRRVLRSLLLLLHACHRLQERRRGFLLGGSSGAGHIIVALAKVAQSPAMAAETLEAAQGAFARTLISPPCQAALTLLCERFVAAVSLANGYVPPTSVFGGGNWRGDDDDDEEDGGGGGGASATSSVYGSRMSMTAGDVLQAVAFMTERPLSATLGPALRYATGCLACLVLSTLIHPAPMEKRMSSSAVASGDALRYVVALSGKLTSQHQRILAQLAQQRLLSIASSWGEQHIASDSSTAMGRESTALLRIAAVASMPRAQAEDLLGAFAPLVVKVDASHHADNWAEVAASLLCVGMAAELELKRLLPLLEALPADALSDVLPPAMVVRLEHLTAVYVRSAAAEEEDSMRALALTGPLALILVGRCVSTDALPLTRSPFMDRQLWPAVLKLLRNAACPVRTIEYLWSPPAALAAAESPHHVSLRECLEHHKSEAAVLLALFASLESPSPPTTAATSLLPLKELATFVLHCGPLLCGLLLATMKSADPAVPAADSLHEVLLYVVTLLSTKLAPAYAVALNEVGRYLVRTVAPAHSAALREAIRRLGAGKASQLRVFMEESCK